MDPRAIELKRVYETPSEDDGLRILVERLWPRGVSKAAAGVDYWAKDVAPTPALRTWYGHSPKRWVEFRRRYFIELEKNHAVVEALKTLCARQRVSFIFAARDTDRNGAVALREFLLANV